MTDALPGFNHSRVLRLMQEAVLRLRLDLSGMVVYTEAASGAYSVTPILAGLAGCRKVYAQTRDTRYGSAAEVSAATSELARVAGVDHCVEILTCPALDAAGEADILTNSGHVRPIGAELVAALKPTAVIPLMYEAWELRAEDVDLAACRAYGIAVAGTNERHPDIDVFRYLGVMATKQLIDAGVAVSSSRVLLLCDNAFREHIEYSLEAAGARTRSVGRLPRDSRGAPWDAVVVALQPREGPVVDREDAEWMARFHPGAVVVQYWGDIDRRALSSHGVPFWPRQAPPPRHMAVLPSDIGPDPIVRLQSGGLKVGEVLARARIANPSQLGAARAALAASSYGTMLQED